MLVFVVLAVFLAGLMVGRTPEYLGKKIESYDVKMCVLALLILIFSILGFHGMGRREQVGIAGLNNAGPHGLSEMLYAYSSGTGNNGSAFAGLNGKHPLVQHDPRHGHALRSFLHDRARPGPGRKSRAEETACRSGGSFPVFGR